MIQTCERDKCKWNDQTVSSCPMCSLPESEKRKLNKVKPIRPIEENENTEE